jgi:hypothetical protein
LCRRRAVITQLGFLQSVWAREISKFMIRRSWASAALGCEAGMEEKGETNRDTARWCGGQTRPRGRLPKAARRAAALGARRRAEAMAMAARFYREGFGFFLFFSHLCTVPTAALGANASSHLEHKWHTGVEN